MADEKKSAYRGFTEAQARAHKKYIAQFVEVKVRMTAEQREAVRRCADRRGESLNAYINRAVDALMASETE